MKSWRIAPCLLRLTLPHQSQVIAMPRLYLFAAAISFLLIGTVRADSQIVRFEPQEIAKDLTIGYAVAVADINGDGKPDIIVVDKHRVVWYENPTWKMRTILQGKTKPDNVCIAVTDIDGDGKLDIVIGAGWAPFDTKNPGTLQWLKRGKSLDDEWTMHSIPCDEPTVHRVRIADLYGDGKKWIVVAPLMGREATQKANWMDGRPVRILAYPIPQEPEKSESWKPEVVNDSLHGGHNIATMGTKLGDVLLCASYEGFTTIGRNNAGWRSQKQGAGNQENTKGNRGSSEIKLGSVTVGQRFKSTEHFVSTIEPWHGHQVVIYATGYRGPDHLMTRYVVDDHLRWGHAVWFADLDGDGSDELIIGVRDDPGATDKFKERRGVRVYKCTDGKGEKWERQIVDNGGVAVEDLTAADLDGDGKIDIIAVGRQTGNLRVYWNKGK